MFSNNVGRNRALQNHMALDYLLASQGQRGAIIGQECCTYISDGFQVQQTEITLTERAVEEWQKKEDFS